MGSTVLLYAILIGKCLVYALPVGSSGSNYQIQWGLCPEDSPPGLDCGQIEVPLDWNDPTGDNITIGMNRLNATDSANKVGSLLFNPGGPGGVATQLCLAQALGVPVFSDALTQNFDLVCPDPRGVGTSTPVICDPELWNQKVGLFPDTQVEFEELIAVNRAKGESCLNLTGPLLGHLDTVSVAKDFEAIRLALDDGPLNYLGISYGSFIGTTYAELFPKNFRAMAIDGILDHTQDLTSLFYVESTGYENVLNRFFQWCAMNATACGLAGDDLPQMFDDLVNAADKSAIPAPGCSVGTCYPNVTGDEIRLSAQEFLQFKTAIIGGYVQGWDALGSALNQSITQNNATLFSSFLATSKADNMYPPVAIACLDFDRINTTNTTQAFAEIQEIRIAGDAFNRHVSSASQSYTVQAYCAGWPVPVANPQHRLNQTSLAGVPPILMVNSVHDPSTSYIWALSVKEQIANAVLVTRQGDGHTSYFLRGQATDLIDSYLVNGTLPEPGTVIQS